MTDGIRFDEGEDELEVVEAGLLVKRGQRVAIGDGEGEIPAEVAKKLKAQGWVDAKQSLPGANADEPSKVTEAGQGSNDPDKSGGKKR